MKQKLFQRLLTGITLLGLLALTAPAATALDVKDLLDIDVLKKEQAKCMETYRSCNGHWCSQLKSDAKELKKCRNKCNKSYEKCLTLSGEDTVLDQLAKVVQKRKDEKLAQDIAAYAKKRLAKRIKENKKCFGLTNTCDEKCYKLADKKFNKKYKKKYAYDKDKPEEHKYYYDVATKCRAKKKCYQKSFDCSMKVDISIPVVDGKMKKMIKKLK